MDETEQTIDPESPRLPDPDVPTFLGMPINRIITFLGPQISWLAGLAATWLVEHATFVGLDFSGWQGHLVNVLTFLAVTGLTWLGQQKWLKGHHIVLEAQAREQAIMAEATVGAMPAPYDDEYDDEAEADRLDSISRGADEEDLVDEASEVPPLPDLGEGVQLEEPISEEELMADDSARVRPTPDQ